MPIAGKYYSDYLATVGANEDLVDKLKTDLSLSNILIKKMTLASTTEIHVSINYNDYSALYLNSDSVYALSLSDTDVAVYSIRILESGVASIFLGIIYV